MNQLIESHRNKAGAKLIRELLADKKEISVKELDEKAKEQGIL